jgi:hypothetical protein
VLDAEHKQVKEIVEFLLDEPKLDSEADNMVHKLERKGFLPFEVIVDFVKD